MEQLVSFPSQGQGIFANLGLPYKGAPGIIMSHGLEGSKDGYKWLVLAPRFYEAGFACLRFSYRGCGRGEERGEGEFEDTTLSGRVEDYRAAIDFMETAGVDANRLGVVGSSFGGMVALAARDSRIKAMVILATPATLPMPAEEQLRVYPEGEFFELPSGRRLRASFWHDIRRYDLCQAMQKVGCPVLLIQGSADEIVPVGDAQRLYERAQEPKRLVVIEGGDHALDAPGHLEQVAGLTLNWFQRYL